MNWLLPAGIALVLILMITTFALSPEASKQANEPFYPDPTNYVVDSTGVLAPEVEDALNSHLAKIKDQAQIAVAVIDTTAPLTIEEYGIKLAEKWKVGDAEKDNGVILILAVSDRKVRIEVGQGVEDKITDAKAGQIIDTAMIPHLKNDDWNVAIISGVESIKTQLTK